MDIKVKTAAILISTLLIGIVVGFIGSRQIMRGKINNIEDRPLPARFEKSLMRMIRPTEQQRDTVGFLIRKYTNRFDSLNRNHHFEMEILIDSLTVEVLPLLDEKQQKTIELQNKNIEKIKRQLEDFKKESQNEIEKLKYFNKISSAYLERGEFPTIKKRDDKTTIQYKSLDDLNKLNKMDKEQEIS